MGVSTQLISNQLINSALNFLLVGIAGKDSIDSSLTFGWNMFIADFQESKGLLIWQDGSWPTVFTLSILNQASEHFSSFLCE
jgi:hypothetical protein